MLLEPTDGHLARRSCADNNCVEAFTHPSTNRIGAR
jgi:hypothetical protein